MTNQPKSQPSINVAPEGTPARIIKWIQGKNFGFLEAENGEQLFFHESVLCSHLRPDFGKQPDSSKKMFVAKSSKGAKGPKAESVLCEDCAAPEVWEMQPVGRLIRGVREIVAVCVNKPNAYKSPISYETLQKANKEFYEAEKIQKIWSSPWEKDNISLFFDTFGEPDAITTDNTNIALIYGEEQRLINKYDGIRSNYWTQKPTGNFEMDQWGINAEFTLEEVSGLTFNKDVVKMRHGQAYLEEAFHTLPSSTQNKIIADVKKHIQNPEVTANNKWQKFIEMSYIQKEIDQLKQKLIDAQIPGEFFVTKETYEIKYEGGLSNDERRSGEVYYEEVTHSIAYVGVKSMEIPKWGTSSVGGKKLDLPDELDYTQSSAEVKRQFIDYLQQSIQARIDEYRDQVITPSEPRIYELSPEEWQSRYHEAWKKHEQLLLEKLNNERKEVLSKMEVEYARYLNAVDRLLEARARTDEIQDKARELNINLIGFYKPSFTDTSSATDDLELNIKAHCEYYNEITEYLKEVLAKKNEVYIDTKEEAEEVITQPHLPVKWLLYGVDLDEINERINHPVDKGFGPKIAGKEQFLPGEKQLIAIGFRGKTSRYSTVIKSTGLSEDHNGFGIPSRIRKQDDKIIALAENSDWQAMWIDKKDDMPIGYGFANAKGIADYDQQIGRFNSNDWEGNEGAGPTEKELSMAHGITIERSKSPDYRKSTEMHTLVENHEVEIKMPTTFTFANGRYFQCECGCMERVTKSDMKRYESGESIEINCTGCEKTGTVVSELSSVKQEVTPADSKEEVPTQAKPDALAALMGKFGKK